MDISRMNIIPGHQQDFDRTSRNQLVFIFNKIFEGSETQPKQFILTKNTTQHWQKVPSRARTSSNHQLFKATRSSSCKQEVSATQLSSENTISRTVTKRIGVLEKLQQVV